MQLIWWGTQYSDHVGIQNLVLTYIYKYGIVFSVAKKVSNNLSSLVAREGLGTTLFLGRNLRSSGAESKYILL